MKSSKQKARTIYTLRGAEYSARKYLNLLWFLLDCLIYFLICNSLPSP